MNSKKPDKVRIVYYCSALAGTKCLNDYLMKGPDLTSSLVAVLLRFKKWLVPVTADVEAMFHQINELHDATNITTSARVVKTFMGGWC